MEDSWKKFEEIELSHSSVHHLMAINTLLRVNGYARGIDISRFLNLTRGSVSITTRKLIEKGYIKEDENKFLKLTKMGSGYINSVLNKRNIMIKFFRGVLKMTAENAEVEACRIEHIMSENAVNKLFRFMGYLLSEDTNAVRFREGFSKFRFKCETIDNCHVCDETCLFSKENHNSKNYGSNN